MTTTDDLLFSRDKPRHFLNSNNIGDDSPQQYSNLNLNQIQKSCLNIRPVQSFSTPKDNKQFDPTVPEREKEKSEFSNKSSILFSTNSSSNIPNDKIAKDETKKRWMNDSYATTTKISSSSTLSLHISAYENSTEASDAVVSRDGSFKEKEKNRPHLNLYEFPRQQEQTFFTDPEVMQFKASQRLLNPDQTSTLNQEDNEAIAPYLYLIMIGLHIFALWPLTLFYCKSKKKRMPRKVGKSCESLLMIDKGNRSTIKSAIPVKKLTTPSKMLRQKPSGGGEKKDDSNEKKKTEKSEEKKDDPKQTGTTTDKTKESPKLAKTPTESPKKEQSTPTKPDPSKPSNVSDRKKRTEKTQEATDLGGRSDKTQSQTEQENLEHE